MAPFSWSYPGGVMIHADRQARALARLGADCRVIVGLDPPGLLTRLVHRQIGRPEPPPSYVLPMGRTVGVPANHSTAKIVLVPRSLGRVKSVLAQERFDVLHIHDPFAPLLSLAALAWAECPTVATCHSSGRAWYPVGGFLFGRLVKSLDYRIAVSGHARAAALPHLGGPIEVLPNGVDVPALANPSGRRSHIVFIGRAERRKGLSWLLRAWPRIAEETGARLRIVGAEPSSVRHLLRRLAVDDRAIDVLGIVSDEQLTSELLQAKALVAPSIGGESFGMVLAQAFACATPVVCSDIPGYRELATDDTSVLVPPKDSRALADAVVELVQDEPRRQARGITARELALERYSWDQIAARLLAIYEELRRPIGQRRHGG